MVAGDWSLARKSSLTRLPQVFISITSFFAIELVGKVDLYCIEGTVYVIIL